MEPEVKKAAIIHPGAIGDCLVLLPLANYLKEFCGIGMVDLIAHADYVRFYPGRTCIDRIRSIESLPLHRLFAAPQEFEVAEKDPLITAFSGYDHVISFLGADNEHFEQNLLFVIHCSHAGDVTMLPLAGPKDTHTALFYIQQFIQQNQLETPLSDTLTNFQLSALPQDMAMGADILSQYGIGEQQSICLIHPGSGSAAKCPPIDLFTAIAEVVRRHRLEPVFLLGPAEMERLNDNDKEMLKKTGCVLSNLSLENVLGVLSCADCFLGNDSGVSHMAGAMGKKTIVLFGPTNPAQYKPMGPNVYVIENKSDDFTTPSPDTHQWLGQCIHDILGGTGQKHLTRTDKSL